MKKHTTVIGGIPFEILPPDARPVITKNNQREELRNALMAVWALAREVESLRAQLEAPRIIPFPTNNN